MSELAPIALFVYNRVETLQITIDTLLKNQQANQSRLYIFSDGPKNETAVDGVTKVRDFLKTITGFADIVILERDKNLGLAHSIITGVTEMLQKYNSVIVLEDDLVLSPYFLKFMNDSLQMYANDEQVASVHAYLYPYKKTMPETFFSPETDCLGWGTWTRAWKYFEADGTKLLKQLVDRKLVYKFNINGSYNYYDMLRKQTQGKVSSWAVRWQAAALLLNKLTLNAGRSLVQHQHFGEGTHVQNLTILDTELSDKPIVVERIPAKPDKIAMMEKIRFMLNAHYSKNIRWRVLIKYVFLGRFFQNILTKNYE